MSLYLSFGVYLSRLWELSNMAPVIFMRTARFRVLTPKLRLPSAPLLPSALLWSSLLAIAKLCVIFASDLRPKSDIFALGRFVTLCALLVFLYRSCRLLLVHSFCRGLASGLVPRPPHFTPHP